MTSFLVLLGLVLSGAAGLVQQVCWIRAASATLGSTTLAVSTVVAVFFLGLALGSEAFGRIALGRARPLRTLAAVEVAVAVLSAGVLPALERVDPAFGVLYRATGGAGPALAVGRGLLLAIVLLPPTLAMGAALPLVTRRIVSDAAGVLPGVGGAYAANTLGALLGCAAGGLVALPVLGLAGAVAAGVAASLAAALAFVVAARGETALAPLAATGARRPTPARPALAAVTFVAGFVALGSEILWTRFLALWVRHSFETYALALAVVLAGMVLGSAAVARWPAAPGRRPAWLGATLVAHGLVLWTTMNLPSTLWLGLEGRLLPLGLLLLPPATLAGAAFPLAVGIGVRHPARAAAGVGRLMAASTLGGIGGSLFVGFAAVPRLGMDATLTMLSALALAAGAACWLVLDRDRLAGRAPAFAATLGLAFLGLATMGGARLPEDALAARDALVDHREGATATLAVVRADDGALHLEMDGWWQGSDGWTHQAMAAHLPLLLHPDPRRMLVVGVGAGQTPAQALLHDVERLEAVDVEPAVFGLLREHFDARWMDDPRTRVVHADGRARLLHGEGDLDVIALELGQSFRPGVASFYTVELYARARRRLAPGGLLVQFVPLAFLDRELFAAVVASFIEVFPQALLWYNTSELLLIGGDGEGELGRRLRERLARPAIRAALDRRTWGGPGHEIHRLEVFLAGLLAGPAELAALAGDAQPLRDGDLRLELGAARVAEWETRELALLPFLRRHRIEAAGPLAVSLDPEERAAVARLREQNLGAIEAEAWTRSVAFLDPARDGPEIDARLARALAANPEHGPTRRRLGERALLAGQPGVAVAHLAAAVRIEPEDVAARRALGVALIEAGRAGEAAHHLRRVVAARPGEAEAHNQLGVALARQGHVAPAIRAFEQALRLEPGHAGAADNLARARRLAGPRRPASRPDASKGGS